MVQVFDLGLVALPDWSLFLLGDLAAFDIDVPITNGVAGAGPGIVSIPVAADLGDIELSVELYDEAPPEPPVEEGDDVVELAWRPGADNLSVHTTVWEIAADPIPLPPSADGSYTVQVHTHNRDAVAGLFEVPDDFEDRERVTIRLWCGTTEQERVLALGSKFARESWSQGELPDFVRQTPRRLLCWASARQSQWRSRATRPSSKTSPSCGQPSGSRLWRWHLPSSTA
ncbi:MAG: hypothetical protein ACRDX8_00820 [Acidimicrobiales bacterium]